MALVTGGASGIGAATVDLLRARGAHVVAADIQAGDGVERLDVTDETAVDALVDDVVRRHGRLDLAANVAGTSGVYASVADASTADWRATMAVNLDALFHCCQSALADLLSAPSARIVTVSSIAGLKGAAYIAPYVAAKHGAVGLTRALAAEFAATNLTVNAVCPGYVETDIVANAIANIRRTTGRSEEEARAALEATNPQGRLITPEEVANAVLWLCLPESGSVNGQAIAISGGDI